MFENGERGWHGSYSKVGRDSAEKYPMIMQKDKILANQIKKYKIKDYFNTDDDFDFEKTMDYEEDIFSQTYKRKNEKKERYKNVCALKTEKTMSDDYKYHQIHHKGLHDYNLIIKGQKRYQTNSSVNLPKDDLTTKRILTGPEWSLLTGRENKFLNKNRMNTDFYDVIDNHKKDVNTFEMVKQTQRGNLPISYDLRIRIVQPFNKTTNQIWKNRISPIKLSGIQNVESPKNGKSKITFKKFDEKKDNYSLSFAKNISREKYYYLKRDRNEIRPFFIPNYKYVEPRSITTVTYNQKRNKNPPLKRNIGIETNLFYDPYKVINKVNNHKTENSPDLKAMEGREDKDNKEEINLPGYMNNIHNRNSLGVFTKKTLKMNGYINGEMKNLFSSFNKKSFNLIINYNMLKNGKEIGNLKLRNISRKINTDERIKRLMEFYSNNLDDENKFCSLKKIDGITYKSINSNVELSEKEKKLFSLT